MTRVEALATLPSRRAWTLTNWTRSRRSPRPVQWDAGTTVFREGDRDSFLYVVEEGRVAIEIAVPGRGRVIILTVGPGEVFGWSSIFQQRPKTASARTIEPTRALALDAGRLRELCDADPRLGYLLTRRILEVVSERLKATRMQLLDIYGPLTPCANGAGSAARRDGGFSDAGISGSRTAGHGRSSSTSLTWAGSSTGSGKRATRSSGRPSRKGRSSSTRCAAWSNCPSAGPTSKRGAPIGSSAATMGPISAMPSGRTPGRNTCSRRD